MLTHFQRLFTVLSGSSQAQLRRQVQYLKAENQILRSRLPRAVQTTPAERSRLLKLGRPLGKAINEIITIVSPKTFARWVRRARRGHPHPSSRRGRPRTAASVRALILRLGRETDWGYTRIQGELLKLGYKVSRGTIVNVLREHQLPRAPDRREGTWDQYLKRHARTLWACDFVSKRIWTPHGLVHAFVLVFIHIATRRVHVAASTTRPDADWAARQGAEFARAAKAMRTPCTMLLRDRDTKFGMAFDKGLRAAGIRPTRLPYRTPNLNAHCERVIQTLQQECLDHFTVLGTRHLDHLLGEFTDYYNRQRPHSAIDFRVPMQKTTGAGRLAEHPPDPHDATRVKCQTRLGGLVHHYHRAAA